MAQPPSSPINPSQAVEKIREIIVGRQLERIEQRIARLEATGGPSVAAPLLEDRLCTSEARIEALQESLQRVNDGLREETRQRSAVYQEEIRHLAAQIQQVAAMRAAESPQPAIERLEARLGSWLSNWQGALQTHLNQREQQLATRLRQEVASLWENTESQITRLQSRMIDRDQMEERFSRIAAAARALAESASPPPQVSESPHP